MLETTVGLISYVLLACGLTGILAASFVRLFASKPDPHREQAARPRKRSEGSKGRGEK